MDLGNPDSVSAVAPHGMMVEVFWKPDDVGVLKIARHSELKPAAKVLDAGRDVGALFSGSDFLPCFIWYSLSLDFKCCTLGWFPKLSSLACPLQFSVGS